MFYFRTRDAARKFATKGNQYRYVDIGKNAPQGKRYAVQLMVAQAA